MAEPGYSTPLISLKDLRNALSEVGTKWRLLGVQFGFTEEELDATQQSHPHGGVSQWLSSMLNSKLNNSPGFTWADVVKALENIGQSALAAQLREKYCVKMFQADSNRALAELIEENDSRLRDEFAALLEHTCSKLEAKISPSTFRTYAKVLFAPAKFISNRASIREIFDAITDHQRWNYLRYRSLLRILQRYKIDDTETRRISHDYEQSVAHFIFTTKVKDWIKKREYFQRMNSRKRRLKAGEYSELTVKLDIGVTEATLRYVDELWTTISEQLFQLPDLDAVLHDIKEGCILVTWRVPNSEEFKIEIRQKTLSNSEFFMERNIKYLGLDEEYFYISKDQLREKLSRQPTTTGGSRQLRLSVRFGSTPEGDERRSLLGEGGQQHYDILITERSASDQSSKCCSCVIL